MKHASESLQRPNFFAARPGWCLEQEGLGLEIGSGLKPCLFLGPGSYNWHPTVRPRLSSLVSAWPLCYRPLLRLLRQQASLGRVATKGQGQAYGRHCVNTVDVPPNVTTLDPALRVQRQALVHDPRQGGATTHVRHTRKPCRLPAVRTRHAQNAHPHRASTAALAGRRQGSRAGSDRGDAAGRRWGA